MGIPLTPAKPAQKKKKPDSKTTAKKTKEEEKEEDAVALGKANPAMMIFYMKAHCGWRETIVNRDIVEFTDNIPDSTKDRLNRIFERSQKKNVNIKPKIVTKKGTIKNKKGKNAE